jgi:uncharacterized membrane protein YeaQ/YmgE (transglycosylase-associated protein family)
MGILVSLIIGGIVGWLGSLVMKTDGQMGIVANVVIGIVGSALGFWIAGLLGLSAGSNIARWLISVAGAAILIAILKSLKVLG